MQRPSVLRFVMLALALLLGSWWSLASSDNQGKSYPNGRYLMTAGELLQRQQREPLVIVDVRTDEYFDGKLIPGAIRMPWSRFRREDPATNMGGLFVGPAEAQRILGEHGLFRNDLIVLYDSVARDGGATASYVFWVLDLLGHERMAILERGIDGWMEAGGDVSNTPQEREPLLYQAPSAEIDRRLWVDEDFIYPRLGDPYYQILDVRSAEEYLGDARNTGLDGTPLKAGHIPGSFNINYESNWIDAETKALKSRAGLADMYRGLDPTAGVIVYCHSARRGSFGYFVLRLLGFEDVMLYDNSWFGWGDPQRYYPVETTANALGDRAPTKAVRTSSSGAGNRTRRTASRPTGGSSPGGEDAADEPSNDGYISCGG